ncbi:probable inorganic polyphosphate/ATP-NAD kinase [Clostridium sp. CAG:448]|nr:probable inorganic polyphosphate/ATP-NAD kinase [Clostridium sp. CAG:448]
MKKIALITNFNIYEKVNAAIAVAQRLSEYGCKLLVSTNNKERMMRMNRSGVDFSYLPLDEVYANAEIAVVLGGDGTILEAARRAAPRATPILGINLGRVGYMAELELNELDMLPRLMSGDYTIDVRSMLQVEQYSVAGKLKSHTYALNDAVISNGSIARIVDLELSENGLPVTRYRADGLIIATPTGSTAYSLSAGGAIVDPRLGCFCVTPICPHSLGARPLLFPDNAVLQVKNTCQRERNLFLTVDGRTNYELFRNETVRISRSDLVTNLIRMKNNGFYHILRMKMTEHT